MSQSRIFPFRRVSVDHMVRGVSRIWWQLERTFNDPGPYTFQLQFGRSGIRDSFDWQDVGAPVENTYYAADPNWRDGGYALVTHYRVKLTTPTETYVSQAANCFGELTERDWLLSREIIRKEKLRHRLVSAPGYLAKPLRYGTPCRTCRDQLTQEVTDSFCPVCSGTGFEIGFHPILPLQCWDLSPQVIEEDIDSQLKGQTRENAYVTARVLGFPALNKGDYWINGDSDERWVVKSIQVVAAVRNVPIVYQVKLGLLPFSDQIYALEIGGEPPARQGPVLPIEGCGTVIVDHDYGGDDNLIYTQADGCPITGANIYVFKRADFDTAGVGISRDLAIAQTGTRVNGRWNQSLKLDPGAYILLYEKPGEFGPDTTSLTVTDPAASLPATAVTPVSPPPRKIFRPKTDNGFFDI